jgi:hypothetical protein
MGRRSCRWRFLAGGWGSSPRGGRCHPGREEGAATLGEEVDSRRGARGRRRGGGPQEKGRGPRGRRRQSTGRRGGALADDDKALVEVSGALLEDSGVVGGAPSVGEDGGVRWEILAA